MNRSGPILFKTDEIKTLPFYALGLVSINAFFGLPKDIYSLGHILNGQSIAWINFQIIVAIGIYCLSKTAQAGGRNLRDALFGRRIQLSIKSIFIQTSLIVISLWIAVTVSALFNICYKSGFQEALKILKIWPEFLYSISASFASVLVVGSLGLFIDFLNGWTTFQILYFITPGILHTKWTHPRSLEYVAWPVPLFYQNLEQARVYPVLTLIQLMACPAIFAYAYKVWREKQWYLRKA